MQENRPPVHDSQHLPAEGGSRRWDHEYAEAWFKSSRCSGGDCVEIQYVARSTPAGAGNAGAVVAAEQVRVRDSKNPDGPILKCTTDEWGQFVASAKAGSSTAKRSPIGTA